MPSFPFVTDTEYFREYPGYEGKKSLDFKDTASFKVSIGATLTQENVDTKIKQRIAIENFRITTPY